MMRRGIFGDVLRKTKERERENQEEKYVIKMKKLFIQKIAEAPNGPSSQEHSLGVKTWYSLK